jgi:hypothetical protein
MRKRDSVELIKERNGRWAVKINLFDDTTVMARPGTGGQKVVYDKPERVPRYLKFEVVPKLISQAHLKNLKGE